MVENITRIKSGIAINVGVSVKIRKNIMCTKKVYLESCYICSYENGKHLGSIIGNLVV